MSVLQAYSKSFMILREHWKALLPTVALLLIAFLIALVASAFFIVQASAAASSLLSNAAIVVILVLFLSILLAALFLQGMYASIASQGIKGEVSLGQAFDDSRSRLSSLFIFDLIYVIVAVAIGAALLSTSYGSVLSEISAFSSASGSSMAGFSNIALIQALFSTVGPLFIAFVSIMFLLGIFFYTGPPLIVLEKKGGIEGLVASFSVGRTRFVTILLIELLAVVITLVSSFLVGALSLVPYVGQLLGLVVQIIITSWLAMVPAVFYIENVRNRMKS